MVQNSSSADPSYSTSTLFEECKKETVFPSSIEVRDVVGEHKKCCGTARGAGKCLQNYHEFFYDWNETQRE